MSRLTKLAKETMRVGPLALLAGVIIWPDDSRHVILFGVGIVALAVVIAHVIRKLIFPYINMEILMDKADQEPLSSAIVLTGLIYLLATIVQSLVMLLK